MTFRKKCNGKRSIGKGLILIFSWIIITANLCASPLSAQTTPQDTTQNDPASQQKYPERRNSSKTWEQIVSFPGMVVFFPLKIVLKGMGGTAGLIGNTQIIKHVQNFFTFDNELKKIRLSYSSRSGAGIKLYQKNLFNEGSRLGFYASAGLRSRQDYRLAFEGVRIFNNSIRSDFSIRYRMLPDEKFYGIGPETKKDDLSNYAFEQSNIHVGLHAQLSTKMAIGALLSLEQNNIHKGKSPSSPSTTELFSPDYIPGMETGIKMVGGSIDWSYDSRNSKGGPTRGKEIRFSGSVYNQILDDDYGFWKMAFDITQHVHLFYGRNVVFRIASEITEPLNSRAVPFYYMAELGRQETIRGFNRGRFRDLDMVLGSIEYRCPIQKRREMNAAAFLFVDCGQVTDDISKVFNTGQFHFGFGGGIRVWSPEGYASAFIISKSKEQYRLYFVLNQ